MSTFKISGKDNGPGGSHMELFELQRELQASNRLVKAIIVVIVIAGVWFWLASRVNPLDRSMGIQATEIEKAVQRYFSEELDYPDDLDQVTDYVSVSGVWPHEPYSGRLIEDTGSADFDPENSVGMVHYEHLETNDMSGYRLTVFGRRGVLETRYGGHVYHR